MISRELWNANQDLARACLDHPFVKQLGDGSLGRDAFCRYVAQDAFFLKAFFRAYALGAARCDDFDHARRFHEFMGAGLEELTLHARYAERLDIDLSRVEPYAACQAYTDFLMRMAWHGTVPQLVAAMTPCMRLYAWLGTQLSSRTVANHPYRDWILTYSGDEFAAAADGVERLLDDVAPDTDTEDVANAYRYALECELDFFSAPLAVFA